MTPALVTTLAERLRTDAARFLSIAHGFNITGETVLAQNYSLAARKARDLAELLEVL